MLNLISNLDIKNIIKNKIINQNSSEVTDLVFKNSRLSNFLFDIQRVSD